MNILLTSAGRRSYLVNYFKEALAGEGLIHASNSSLSPALVYADKSVITPLIYDEGYIEFLINYCKSNNITAIISLFDIDLPVLAKSKEQFVKEGIQLIVSDYSVINICNDKWKTYKFLQDKGIKTPKTYLSLKSISDELDRCIIDFPLTVKPRWGMGSIGIYIAEDKNELDVLYQKTMNNISNSYLKYESSEDMENCVIIQEHLEGKEYGLDIINDLNSEYITTFIKKKIDMRSGETDAAVTEYNPIMETLGKTISKFLKHIAILDVDCFLLDKQPYVIEMNSRFGGHYPFSHLAGANIPKAIIDWLKGENPDRNLFTIKNGIRGIKDINPIII